MGGDGKGRETFPGSGTRVGRWSRSLPGIALLPSRAGCRGGALVPLLEGAAAPKHDEDGAGDDRQVPGGRVVGDVVAVELDHAFVVQRAAPLDLPRAGQAGPDPEATRVAPRARGGEPLAVAELEGTGADQAHLAPHDVDQLGQLIQARVPEESP